MAVPDFSMGGVRVYRVGGGILGVHGFCQAARGMELGSAGVRGSRGILRFAGAGSLGSSDVPGLRLLAHQSEFFSGAIWSVVDDFVFCLCVVPVGMGAGGIQSSATTGQDIVAGLLGAY